MSGYSYSSAKLDEIGRFDGFFLVLQLYSGFEIKMSLLKTMSHKDNECRNDDIIAAQGA